MFSKSKRETMLKMGLCTIEGISICELPPSGIGIMPPDSIEDGHQPETRSGKNLEQFLREALIEGIQFIDGVAPKLGGESTWKSKGSPKTFAESDAQVYSSEKIVSIKSSSIGNKDGSVRSGKEKTETWFCRRSCHKNEAKNGTASWDEFNRAFFERHAETEKEFVPTIIAIRRAIHWNTEGMQLELDGERWIDISSELWEMKHRIDPKPLNNRTFTNLQITARIDGVHEFIMVQIPISDFEKSPYSEYARDRSLVVASYTAIERVRIIPEGGDIEWIMATASDAGGVLPQFVQNLAVSGEIAKDVPKFLNWIPSQRS